MENTILGHYSELKDTGEYIIFECKECKTRNGSTIHIEGEKQVVVCGQCWLKQDK